MYATNNDKNVNLTMQSLKVLHTSAHFETYEPICARSVVLPDCALFHVFVVI